ncbi:MAG TPA: hypothetical protein VH796_01750 [Nitrososphaeraceae archaeon]|jgi:hypothetical protein
MLATNSISDTGTNYNKSNETATVTFRIDKSVLDKIRAEATHHNMSLNSFLNQILKEFTEWDMFMPDAGSIPVAKPVVVQMFQKLTKDEIQNLATKIGKNAIEDMVLFMKGSMDLDSFLKWLEVRMKNCSVDINHIVEKNKHTYVMKHELGENWALYNKTMLETIFKELFERPIDIRIHNDAILIFEIQK